MKQRKEKDNTDSVSSELKMWLYVDEGIFFPLKLNKSKVFLKDREILTKNFVCSSNFYRTYIKDNIVDREDILFF